MTTHSTEFITPELLARYDVPGPRYTSYPTALEFHEGVDESHYLQHLEKLAASGDAISMYVHIPFCKSRCHFCGCHTALCNDTSEMTAYVDNLLAELSLLAKRVSQRLPLVALHFGGGTPTYLPDVQMGRIMDKVQKLFDVQPGAEVSIEVNPAVSSPTQVSFLRSLGFNRISVGVQDFNPIVLKGIGRHQPKETTLAIIDAARASGFNSVNLDLVYGLPFQTPASFAHTLDEVLAVRPDRVALYSFAYIPWIRDNQSHIDETALPGRDDKFAFFAMAMKAFGQKDYLQIGMDHFALCEDELGQAASNGTLFRNFMGYTVTKSRNILGVGVSSIGYVDSAFFQNVKDNNTYYQRIGSGLLPVEKGVVLSTDDLMRAQVITELMCNFRLDFAAFEQRFDISFERVFAHELGQLKAQREAAAAGNELAFTEPPTHELKLTPVGRIFVRNVCMVFDRYLKNKTENRPLFSRTV
ncbi:MAG: oxygen-independent coproporphyrinogen III oxidase [Deltaproteobacteria bacterium]|nr:oxygen-independent coproporphyrinogen III oxidase [Deltaproteobacteria bacterium]